MVMITLPYTVVNRLYGKEIRKGSIKSFLQNRRGLRKGYILINGYIMPMQQNVFPNGYSFDKMMPSSVCLMTKIV